jgi:hypothetical protein
MNTLPYTFVGFVVLQVACNYAERWCEHHRDRLKNARHGTVIFMALHPTMLSSLHDLGIYLVGESHILFR